MGVAREAGEGEGMLLASLVRGGSGSPALRGGLFWATHLASLVSYNHWLHNHLLTCLLAHVMAEFARPITI